MKSEIEITDKMIEEIIERNIEKTVRKKLDEYFGEKEWERYDNYNKLLEKVVSKRVNELFTDEKIKEVIDEQKDYIVNRVADLLAEKIKTSLLNHDW